MFETFMLFIFLLGMNSHHHVSKPSNATANDHLIEKEEARHQFDHFIKKFNKPYEQNSQEYQHRYEIFRRTLEDIEKMNAVRVSHDSAIYGLTKWSDLTGDEFKIKKLRRHHSNGMDNHHHHPHNDRFKRAISEEINFDELGDIPKKVDWREKDVISGIRNQGKCGACWAHSVLETIESLVSIKRNTTNIELLSVQQMIDCARNSNYGCNGGNTCNLLEWLVDNKIKIANQSLYPESDIGWTSECKNVTIKSGTKVKSYLCESFVNNETTILKYLATHGPISAAVNAISWQNYLGGIIQYHCDGDPLHLNHAIEIVGYDLTGDIPYYIVRNSWGVEFGNDGYLKIKIGKNLCGIMNEVAIVYVSPPKGKP